MEEGIVGDVRAELNLQMGELRTSSGHQFESFVRQPATVAKHDTFHFGACDISRLIAQASENASQSTIAIDVFAYSREENEKKKNKISRVGNSAECPLTFECDYFP